MKKMKENESNKIAKGKRKEKEWRHLRLREKENVVRQKTLMLRGILIFFLIKS